MIVTYSNLYKFDILEDGTLEKMQGRLDALAWELSLRTKLGCADICMPIYMPEKDFTLEKQKEYEKASIEYRKRGKKLVELINVIKENVGCNLKIDEEYLYELWIYRIFKIDWIFGNALYELEKLKEGLLEDNKINPFDIVIEKVKEEDVHKKKKVFGIFKRK